MTSSMETLQCVCVCVQVSKCETPSSSFITCTTVMMECLFLSLSLHLLASITITGAQMNNGYTSLSLKPLSTN